MAQHRSAPLMRRATIGRLFESTGRKPRMYTSAFIDSVAPEEDKTNPFYIISVAGFCLDDYTKSSLAYGTVIQCCCLGFDNEDVPTAEEAMTKLKVGMRERWTNMPLPGRDALTVDGANPAWVTDNTLVPSDEEVATCLNALKNVEDMKMKAIQFFTTGLLAFSKQGAVTTGVLTKVTNAIRDELGYSITIDPTVIRTVWNVCGSFFDPAKARFFFEMWETSIGAACLRLRLLCNQAGWTGLTNYENIKKARNQYPDFPWGKLAALIPQDFTNYTAAAHAIGGDKYYGYRSDLGPARSTLYPNLSYAAYQLLVVISGDRSLLDFRGTNRNTPRAREVDALIREYETTVRNSVDEVEANVELEQAFKDLDLDERDNEE